MQELDFAFYSDPGGRENNEDAFLSKVIDNGHLFMVADGLGGHDNGAAASNLAVNCIKDYIASYHGREIVHAIQYANQKILFVQQTQQTNMKTTVALAYVTQRQITFAHLGDSRVYGFRQGKIVFQTLDHSVPQMAATLGEITPDQIRHHEDRNVLTRALGSQPTVRPDCVEKPTGQFDALLLCTDGFWEYVLEEEMEAALQESDAADKWLYKMRAIQLRQAPENCDNNTALAVMW